MSERGRGISEQYTIKIRFYDTGDSPPQSRYCQDTPWFVLLSISKPKWNPDHGYCSASVKLPLNLPNRLMGPPRPVRPDDYPQMIVESPQSRLGNLGRFKVGPGCARHP